MLAQLIEGVADAALTPSFPKLLGETASRVPFGDIFREDRPPYRMQQVYAATGFSNLMSQGGWITGMRLISDDLIGRGYGADLPKVEMRLGVTTRGPDALSSVFAENFSGPTVAVWPLGPFFIHSSGRGAYVTFEFAKPFFYDSHAGNLLLEVKNYEPTIAPGDLFTNPSPFDASNVVGDTVSRVYAHGDADAPTGNVDSLGLTTRFVFTVPFVSIARQSTNLVLRWEWTRLVINVERSLALGPAANWQPVTGTLTTNFFLGYVEFALPSDTSKPVAFYRLKLPGLSTGGGGDGLMPATALARPEE